MSIVAPVSATGAAVPVLVGLASGRAARRAADRGHRRGDGRASCWPRASPRTRRPAARCAPSLALAGLAALGFGTFFVLIDRATELGGAPWSLLLVRVGEVALLGALALAMRPAMPVGGARRGAAAGHRHARLLGHGALRARHRAGAAERRLGRRLALPRGHRGAGARRAGRARRALAGGRGGADARGRGGDQRGLTPRRAARRPRRASPSASPRCTTVAIPSARAGLRLPGRSSTNTHVGGRQAEPLGRELVDRRVGLADAHLAGDHPGVEQRLELRAVVAVLAPGVRQHRRPHAGAGAPPARPPTIASSGSMWPNRRSIRPLGGDAEHAPRTPARTRASRACPVSRRSSSARASGSPQEAVAHGVGARAPRPRRRRGRTRRRPSSARRRSPRSGPRTRRAMLVVEDRRRTATNAVPAAFGTPMLPRRHTIFLVLAPGRRPPRCRRPRRPPRASPSPSRRRASCSTTPTRDRTLDEIRDFGVTDVRQLVYWRDFAPRPNAKRKPRGRFVASDPATYPADTWSPLDVLIARRRGARDQGAPQPHRAGAALGDQGRKDNVTRPSPKEFQAWATAVGRRYGDQVATWSIWNEPNQPQFLMPQYRNGQALLARPLPAALPGRRARAARRRRPTAATRSCSARPRRAATRRSSSRSTSSGGCCA